MLKVTHFVLKGLRYVCGEGYVFSLCVEGYVFHFVLRVTCFTLC